MKALTRTLAAVAAAVTVGALTPAVAGAAPEQGSRLVVFGDSQAAGTNLMMTPDERGCWQSETSWPKQLADRLGVRNTPDFVDATCSGGAIDTGGGWLLCDQVRWADSKNAFGPGTETVLLQFGMNDSWGNGVQGYFDSIDSCILNLIDGCEREAAQQNRAQDAAATTPEAFAQRIAPVVDYIKHYAPNARIALVGLPEMTPQRGDEICGTIFGAPVVQPRGGALVDFFAALDDAARGAADRLDLDFVDVRGAFDGHGPCTAQPWVNGIFELDNAFGGPLHPNRVGDVVISDYVARTLSL